MAITKLSFPVFDADNHLYESTRSAHQVPSRRYRGAIDFVEVHGRTKIMVRGHISDYIPNPTFDRVGRPGAQEEYFKMATPTASRRGRSSAAGIDCPPGFREAGAAPRS